MSNALTKQDYKFFFHKIHYENYLNFIFEIGKYEGTGDYLSVSALGI